MLSLSPLSMLSILHLSMLALLLLELPALGAVVRATAPSTAPSTPPIAEQARTLLVLPFDNLNTASPDSWTAVAAQRSLIADLQNRTGLDVLSGDRSAADATSAIAMGRQRDARLVLRGTLQALPTQLRFTGTVLETRSGRTLAILKATGTVDDLFELEETLARQARRAFSTATASAASPSASTESSVAESPRRSITPSGPVRLDVDVCSDMAQAASAGLDSYFTPAHPNDRFAARYARYQGASLAWEPRFYGLGFGYAGGAYIEGYWGGYGGGRGYSSLVPTPLHGFSYAGAPNGTTAYGGGHR